MRWARLALALGLLSPAAGAAQDTLPLPLAARQRPWLAVAEAIGVNLFVNRFDAWATGQAWAHVSPSSWRQNLRLGWEWDENEFGTNLFAHPYHGGLYFNAGRANGLDFWESAPLAFLGSWSWEYLGERFRPSLNDFFMTSVGGIALGESFHRVGASIRDNQARGGGRILREVAALPLDPMGSLNRLVRGEWTAVSQNPPEHDPDGFALRLAGGVQVTQDTFSTDRDIESATLVADLLYRDPITQPYQAPFDVFGVRAQVSAHGALHLLRASGRLYGANLNGTTRRHRHLFEVNQRFDYSRNPAQEFGGQSVEAGIYSRWRLSEHSGLRTQLFADAIILGAMDATVAGTGLRGYDFGPGLGLRTELAFERKGVTWLRSWARSELLHSVSGAPADHEASFGGFEAVVPLPYRFGIGLHTGYFRRVSRYPGKVKEKRDFTEARLFLSWTAVGSNALVGAP